MYRHVWYTRSSATRLGVVELHYSYRNNLHTVIDSYLHKRKLAIVKQWLEGESPHLFWLESRVHQYSQPKWAPTILNKSENWPQKSIISNSESQYLLQVISISWFPCKLAPHQTSELLWTRWAHAHRNTLQIKTNYFQFGCKVPGF